MLRTQKVTPILLQEVDGNASIKFVVPQVRIISVFALYFSASLNKEVLEDITLKTNTQVVHGNIFREYKINNFLFSLDSSCELLVQRGSFNFDTVLPCPFSQIMGLYIVYKD